MRKIAVFASGRGSNFRSLFEHVSTGRINAVIDLLVSDTEQAGALDFARRNAIETVILPPRVYADSFAFGEALLSHLQHHQIDLVVLAGYLKKIPVNTIRAFPNRIINIHPSLLPSFGGKGMYGRKVHQAVFDAGVKVSGVTIHFVDDSYDTGSIVLQRAVDIGDCSSPAEIAEKVLALEHQALPEAVHLLTEHQLVVEGKRVSVGNAIYD